VQWAAFNGEADEAPAGMTAESLNEFDRFVGRERMFKDSRVAEQSIELGKDEFGNSHAFIALNGAQPSTRAFMPRRGDVECVEQQVGVDGEHGRYFLARRVSRSSVLVNWASALISAWLKPFQPRLRGLGSCHSRLASASDVFNAAPGKFGHRHFAGFAQLFRSGEGVVGQLDLCSRHDDRLAADGHAVNTAA